MIRYDSLDVIGIRCCLMWLAMIALYAVCKWLRRRIERRRVLPAPWQGSVSRTPRYVMREWTSDRGHLERESSQLPLQRKPT
jgi:hypothetical protein